MDSRSHGIEPDQIASILRTYTTSQSQRETHDRWDDDEGNEDAAPGASGAHWNSSEWKWRLLEPDGKWTDFLYKNGNKTDTPLYLQYTQITERKTFQQTESMSHRDDTALFSLWYNSKRREREMCKSIRQGLEECLVREGSSSLMSPKGHSMYRHYQNRPRVKRGPITKNGS